MVWAAAEGKAAFSTGEVGVPLIDKLVTDFSFAEADGTGSQLWAGVGFAGSSGGALRLLFGTDEIGWECKTSFCMIPISDAKRHRLRNSPSWIWDLGISTKPHPLIHPSSSDIG